MIFDQLAALLKLLLYAGVLIAGGMALAGISLGSRLGEAEKRVARWMVGGALTATMAALSGAALLIWQLGGFDRETVNVVLDSPSGLALFLQLVGCVFLLAAHGKLRLLRLAGALALFGSFGVNGHAAASSTLDGLIVMLHLLASAWWLGSLILVRSACVLLTSAALANLVLHFGRLAVAVVGVLLVSGLGLTFALVPLELTAWQTDYATNLALKIAFALGALAVATYARTRVVPRLTRGEEGANHVLSRTVTVEIALIGGALAATAWLTTFHSPHECHELFQTLAF